MKTVILAEKPPQAKAYAEAFEVGKREKTHIELKPCSTFPQGATITWGILAFSGIKNAGEYKDEWKKWDIKNFYQSFQTYLNIKFPRVK